MARAHSRMGPATTHTRHRGWPPPTVANGRKDRLSGRRGTPRGPRPCRWV